MRAKHNNFHRCVRKTKGKGARKIWEMQKIEGGTGRARRQHFRKKSPPHSNYVCWHQFPWFENSFLGSFARLCVCACTCVCVCARVTWRPCKIWGLQFYGGLVPFAACSLSRPAFAREHSVGSQVTNHLVLWPMMEIFSYRGGHDIKSINPTNGGGSCDTEQRRERDSSNFETCGYPTLFLHLMAHRIPPLQTSPPQPRYKWACQAPNVFMLSCIYRNPHQKGLLAPWSS